jgi:hypothetical protein
MTKGSNVVICGLLKPFCVVCRGVKFWTPSTQDLEAYSPSTKAFEISMATSSVHPFGIWADTSMSFSGVGTSPPHQTNSAFTYGYAFEHTVTLVRPLPSYQ